MNSDRKTKARVNTREERGFFASIFFAIFHTLAKFVLAFAVGTGASAIACWYYGLPLALSLVGGFIVLGIALALAADSSFY